MLLKFEWDDKKAQTNLLRHRISFDLAIRVFADPFQLSVQDRIENNEYRWQTLGNIDGQLVLLVAHTVREENDGVEVIRIISARKADKAERKRYEQGY